MNNLPMFLAKLGSALDQAGFEHRKRRDPETGDQQDWYFKLGSGPDQATRTRRGVELAVHYDPGNERGGTGVRNDEFGWSYEGDPKLMVVIGWLNTSLGDEDPKVGRLQLDFEANASDWGIQRSVDFTIEKLDEIYNDVQTRSGVAGKKAIVGDNAHQGVVQMSREELEGLE